MPPPGLASPPSLHCLLPLQALPQAALDAPPWSGLTTTQMARLQRSPMALTVAREALAEQVMSAHEVLLT